jgi:hypothetical protein
VKLPGPVLGGRERHDDACQRLSDSLAHDDRRKIRRNVSRRTTTTLTLLAAQSQASVT